MQTCCCKRKIYIYIYKVGSQCIFLSCFFRGFAELQDSEELSREHNAGTALQAKGRAATCVLPSAFFCSFYYCLQVTYGVTVHAGGVVCNKSYKQMVVSLCRGNGIMVCFSFYFFPPVLLSQKQFFLQLLKGASATCRGQSCRAACFSLFFLTDIIRLY